ncbi:hypothetical protein BGZ96_000206 [Linnemannia gamsii]|uniref:C2H2-type domain-containing protein n=1 Tax=Linnemannia gamsii TaxID=64522 RepID=A0ABQ7JPH6_9FUNG|nr:hypothetical protein BGZ96_000206 [Linnemannia gamsii]
MTNKDKTFISPKDVIRTQDGKIDLFQTILARKDPTAQIPVLADPQPQPVATSVSVTNSSGTKAAEESPSLSWRSTHVASAKASASASAASASSPYANLATTTTNAANTSVHAAATTTATVKPVVRRTLWSAVFVEYCKNPLTIPDNIRHWHDNEHIIIKDAYPKASLSAKVHMLVLPRMPVDKVTDLVGEEGIRTVEGLARVANTLMTTLRAENAYLDFKMGFHAIPSMRFFIPPEEVVRTIREKGSFETTVEELNKYGDMKKAALVCNQCSQAMKSIPMLTSHLNEHFTHKVKALKRL